MTAVDPLNAAATVPDVTVFFQRWRAWSDVVRAQPHQRDLRYGPSADETLDLFVPHQGAPLVVFFHGGYWRRLHKDDMTYVAAGLQPHGVAVAVVNYGLAPALQLETIVAQARAAVGWLRRHGAGYGVDAPVTAVASLSGLHDLRAVARSFVNEWLGLDDARAVALSPTLLAPSAPCVVRAWSGERESAAFHAQGGDFAAAWRAHGCDAAYADSPGDNHFTICDRLRDSDDPLVARIAALAG